MYKASSKYREFKVGLQRGHPNTSLFHVRRPDEVIIADWTIFIYMFTPPPPPSALSKLIFQYNLSACTNYLTGYHVSHPLDRKHTFKGGPSQGWTILGLRLCEFSVSDQCVLTEPDGRTCTRGMVRVQATVDAWRELASM